MKNKPPDKLTEKSNSKSDYFKAIKVPLKHILKHHDINGPIITDAVNRCNKIIINTLLFIKLYCLHEFSLTNSLPYINKEFINSCMKICCKKPSQGKPPKNETKDLKDKLMSFYNSDFRPLIQNEELKYTHLNTVLDYLTVGIITMYENNIKLHYVEYVERYINVSFKKKETIVSIKEKYKNDLETQKEEINIFCRQLRKIKVDLLTNSFSSNEEYHDWIKDVKKRITPNKEKYLKDSLYYDLQVVPQDYFKCMITMMKEIEETEETNEKGKKIFIYNVFPLRNDIIMKSIKLDTTTLVHLLLNKKHGLKEDFLTQGNLKKKEDQIWKFFFRTERQCFKKPNYTFHHMIETDGVSCSILLLRNDLIGKRIPLLKNKIQEQYIDEVEDVKKYKNKKIVAIDPNLSDLIYCVDKDTKEANEFRYTQDSRRKECKIKKYNKLILSFKEEEINGKTIIQHETELSHLNRKTLNIEEFKKYIQKKSEINHLIYTFYQKTIFRKLKLNGYLNRKRHEQKMINKFKNLFGEPTETIICIGDYEQKKHMKYKEPVKGKGMRNLFRQNGYEVFLVDEYKTSCMCSKCEEGRCETFMKRESPKPYKKGKTILVHGLLSCKNCNAMRNRDVNSSTNIFRIAQNAIEGKERPDYLSRKHVKEEESDEKKVKKVKENQNRTKSVKVDALITHNLQSIKS